MGGLVCPISMIELYHRRYYSTDRFEDELLYYGDDQEEAGRIVSRYRPTGYKGLNWTQKRAAVLNDRQNRLDLEDVLRRSRREVYRPY